MKEISLVITSYSLIKDSASVIRKHLYVLYLNKEVKEIFTTGSLVSFREKGQLDCLNKMVKAVKFV